MNGKIISAVYLLYGLMDIAIAILSRSILVPVVIVGTVCLAAGAGLWLKKAWSIYLIVFAGLLTFTAGVATLYASIGLTGLNPSLHLLAFHLALLGYVVGAVGLSIYTIVKRSMLLSTTS